MILGIPTNQEFKVSQESCPKEIICPVNSCPAET